MKKNKLIYVSMFIILSIVLVACSNSNKEKLQGTWKSSNSDALRSLGTKVVFKENKVFNDGDESRLDIKSYNFKDEDQTIIRLYRENQNESIYSEDNPAVYGVLKFKDKNTLTIDTNDDGVYELKKAD